MMRLMNNSTLNCEASTSQQKDETNNNNKESDQLNLAQLAANQQQQNLLLEVLSSNPALANAAAAMDYSPDALINAAAAAASANARSNTEIGKSQMQDMADMLMNIGFSPELASTLFNQFMVQNPETTTNQQQQKWELSHSQSNESMHEKTSSKNSVVSTTPTTNKQQQEQQNNNNNNNFINPLNLLQMFSSDLMNSSGIANNAQAQQLFMAAAAEALQTLQSNGNTEMALTALNNLNSTANNLNSTSPNGGWDFNALAALLSNTNEQFGYSSSPSKVY